jgi:hypothetical protein
MESLYKDTNAPALIVSEQSEEAPDRSGLQPTLESSGELMAPGHLYNRRTGTGIEWFAANSDTGQPGRARLWARRWNGQPMVLAEALHHSGSQWEYWYSLEFARSFPQVTHWWFGDAWTGHLHIWGPDAAGVDPESGTPMLTGWMRFGTPDTRDAPDAPDRGDITAVPWTVVLTSPPRVSTPLPPMSTSLVNLPLQLLLAERVMVMLTMYLGQAGYQNGTPGGTTGDASLGVAMVLTSLVRREDLQRAFPTEFGPWQLDRLPDLTPREALCRVQGLSPALQSHRSTTTVTKSNRL